jgi:hypothetical protein
LHEYPTAADEELAADDPLLEFVCALAGRNTIDKAIATPVSNFINRPPLK